MGREDWYRRTRWLPADREEFFRRLERSRSPESKAQYARIQASYLRGTGDPELVRAADGLLDRILNEWPIRTELASTYVQKAECALFFGDFEGGMGWLRKALQHEREFPNVHTQAFLRFAVLVAMSHRAEAYDEALQLLSERSSELFFPVDRYHAAGARAIIAADRGDLSSARSYAEAALDEARREHSGFRYHPNAGLVTRTDPTFHDMIVRIAGA